MASLLAAGMGVTAAGAISYWRGLPHDTLWIPYKEDGPRVRIAAVGGMLHLVYSEPLGWPRAGTKDAEAHFGPFYARRVTFNDTLANGVGAPFWSLAPLLLFVPTMAFVRGPLRRRKRRRRNQCLGCGYSLTGLTESRCPECGRAF